MSERVALFVDGRPITATAGDSVAAALLNSGVLALRVSVTGAVRGPLCGMGTCEECRVTIDGIANQRACLAEVGEGMRITTGTS